MPSNKELKCSCNVNLLNSKRGKYCPHIEQHLPKVSKRSIKAELPEHGIENTDQQAPWIGRTHSDEAIRAFLTDYSLGALELQIVFLRVYKEHTFEEIAEMLKLPGPSSAEYRWNKIKAKIEEEYPNYERADPQR